MLVTRKLLTGKFTPGTGSNQCRLNNVNAARQKYNLSQLSPPDEYLDAINEQLMTHPRNIGNSAENSYYVDNEITRGLTSHPLTRGEIKYDPTIIDQALASRIKAFVVIEEIKVWLHGIQRQHLEAFPALHDSPSDQEISAALAMTTSEILQAYQYSMLDSHLEPFRSSLTQQPVTLPVIVDGKYLMDFAELVMHQQQANVTPSGNEERRIQFETEKAVNIAKAKAERDSLLNKLILPEDAAQEQKEEFEQRKKGYQRFYLNQIELLEKAVFIDPLGDTSIIEAAENLNPFTNKPITSISIDYELLKKLDAFLTRLPIHYLLAPAMRAIRSNNQFMRTIKAEYADKSFAQILQETRYPEDKIPESLVTGFIPGSNQTMLCTHPLLLDDVCLIDYDVLMRFWNQSPDHTGLNPLTGKPAEKITYDEKLKAATDNFILNPDYFRQTITHTQTRKSDFLRQEKTGNFGVTIHSMFSRRRNLRQDQPANRLNQRSTFERLHTRFE